MNSYRLSTGDRISKSVIDARIRKSKAIVLDNQLKEYGFNFCEKCQRSTGVRLDCAHIVSVKTCQEIGYSEKAYKINNIEILCRECHQKQDNLDLRYKIS